MATFSQDQVRQFYIATSKATTLDASSPVGALKLSGTATDLFFNYVSPNGDNGGSTIVRSDLINIKKIDSVVATKAKSRKLKKVKVSLDPSINSGNPVVGQDYIIRFTFFGLGIGGQENQYVKTGGAYRAKTGDTPTTLMAALKALCDKNFSRETDKYVSITATGADLFIEELPQPWVLGKRQADQVSFVVNLVPIDTDSHSAPWGIATDVTASNTNTIKNGRMTADMEWFYLGNRADIFRGHGYPDNFESKYVADPTKEYDYLDIAFHYSGDAEDIQKSKKQLTIAIPTDSTYKMADLVTEIEALGIDVVDKLA